MVVKKRLAQFGEAGLETRDQLEVRAMNTHPCVFTSIGVRLGDTTRAVLVGVCLVVAMMFCAPDLALASSGDSQPGLDKRFGKNGLAKVPKRLIRRVTSSQPEVIDVATDSNGAVVVLANAYIDAKYSPGILLAKFDSRGRLVRAFGHDGLMKFALTTGSIGFHAKRLLIGRDNKPVVIGKWSDGSDLAAPRDEVSGEPPHLVVARFTPGGRRDRSFGSKGSGYFRKRLGGGIGSYVTDAKLDHAGRIVVTGSADTGKLLPLLIRLTETGRLDHSFAVHGSFVGIDYCVEGGCGGNAIWVRADDSLIVQVSDGMSSKQGKARVWLTRFSVDGTLDRSFGSSGLLLLASAESLARRFVSDFLVGQNEGTFLVTGGDATSPMDLLRWRVHRYLKDGTLDPSFANQGFVWPLGTETSRRTIDFGSRVFAAPDGGYVATNGRARSGRLRSRLVVTSLTASGLLNAGFNGNGILFTRFANAATSYDGENLTAAGVPYLGAERSASIIVARIPVK